jgi:hypothetical protein
MAIQAPPKRTNWRGEGMVSRGVEVPKYLPLRSGKYPGSPISAQ